jgi:hypothetical protein
MAQQTSVEWLLDEIEKQAVGQCEEIPIWIYIFIEQAKEMHKEEMYKCASFWRGKENDIEKPIFEEYYNETFNNGTTL